MSNVIKLMWELPSCENLYRSVTEYDTVDLMLSQAPSKTIYWFVLRGMYRAHLTASDRSHHPDLSVRLGSGEALTAKIYTLTRLPRC